MTLIDGTFRFVPDHPPHKVGDVIQLMTSGGLTRFVVTDVDPESGEVRATAEAPEQVNGL